MELPTDGAPARQVWSHPVKGRVVRLLAANGILIGVTQEGCLLAFGGQRVRPRTLTEPRLAAPRKPEATERATALLKQADGPEGYALWLSLDDRELLEAVLRQSKLQIVGLDSDAAKVAQLRRYFDARGLYGRRVALHTADLLQFKAPPYVANLVVVADSLAPALAGLPWLRAAYESVRPYGGRLWVSSAAAAAHSLTRRMEATQLAKATLSLTPNGLMVVREGALPGAAAWTHQYGDVANTVKSNDQLVKLPLGLLWFGGNNNLDVLPRHGHGPSEQVVGGRLFIEGMNCLNARDVYTGRVLWKTEFKELGNFGVYYDASYTNLPLATLYNQTHIPGANARGANFVATADAVYVVTSNACRVLDPRQGKTIRTLALPPRPGETKPPAWGYLGVYENVLLAGSGFAGYSQRLALSATNPPAKATANIVDLSASLGLVAMDRHTGRVLWQVQARYSFPHNGIVAGNGRVYCLDKLPKSVEDKWKRRGHAAPRDYRLAAFDARTGRLVWETTTNILGTWLSYSQPRDVLLQAGASASDRLSDEADRGMIAYRGADGAVRWEKLDLKYTGPCILHHDTILTTPGSNKTNAGAFNLLDGTPCTVANPLTGRPEPLRIYRTHGCNYPVACEHLVTFRSGAAGFYDLEKHSGTGNFGGFRSGCSPNLIAADGVLNAPDYTRTCTCPYQNQTSLALVPAPELADEIEVWTHNQFGADAPAGTRIERVGINFGAPGDRLSEAGTLWLEYPNVGGSSPNLLVTVEGCQPQYFRRQAGQLAGAGPAWVMSSGVSDADTIFVNPATRPPSMPGPTSKKSTEEDDDPDNPAAKTSKAASAATAATTTATTNSTIVPAGATKPANPRGVEPPLPIPLEAALYTVRLYFAEPDDLRPGERQFDVQLQGRTVLTRLDVVAEAGGRLRGIIKEFSGVEVSDQLAISFITPPGQMFGAILCGVEMIHESTSRAAGFAPGNN